MPTIKMNGRNLIPLSQNTKPLLKLGERESSNIKQLSKAKDNFNKKISDLEYELGLPGLTDFQKNRIKQQINSFTKKINENDAAIREIKVNAYKRQLLDYMA